MGINVQYVYRFAVHFFPAMVDVILGLPPNRDNCSSFNSLLRDMCLVWLRWKMLFERTSTGALMHSSEILQPAKSLMRHLALIGFNPSSDVARSNHDYLRVFAAQWRSTAPLPG